MLFRSGTLLLVSHDREFLNNVVTSTFALEGDGSVRQFPGGYDDYVRQRGTAPAHAGSAHEEKREKPPRCAGGAAAGDRKLSYNERRELDALPDKIAALEGELAEIRGVLADSAVYRDDPIRAKALGARLPCAEAELEAAVDRWAELAEREGT